jgi:cob(I)alamin adenosyltransferase
MARLTKIYTRTGDEGTTGLVGGRRVRKDALRIHVLGTVDELNAAIGLSRALNRRRPLDTILAGLQNDLFDLGAALATQRPVITPGQITVLEKLMDQQNTRLGPLQEFILPGGSPVGAALHVARTVCRRAERDCVRLARRERIGDGVVPYLNRLGDVLFVLARWANRSAKRRETYWVSRSTASGRTGR